MRRVLLTLVGFCCLTAACGAAEPNSSDPKFQFKPLTVKPLVVINFASYDRAMNQLGKIFDAVDRPDMKDLITTALEKYASGLKGVDKTRPFGVMWFVDFSLRTIVVHPFIPVADEEQFRKTCEATASWAGPYSKNTYRLHDGVAWFGIPKSVDFENEFAEGRVATDLAAKYDVALSIRLCNLPPLIRQVFTGMLRTASGAQLQQRDEESDADYKWRRAYGMTWMGLLEQTLRTGEEITLGVDVAGDGKRAVAELIVRAAKGSDMASVLEQLSGTPSEFAALRNSEAPLSIALSFDLDERLRPTLTSYVEAFRAKFSPTAPEELPMLHKIADVLQATIDQGRFDAIFQVRGVAPLNARIMAGLQIAGPETFSAALGELWTRQTLASDRVSLANYEHRGTTIHQLSTATPTVAETSADIQCYATQNNLFLLAGGGAGAADSLKEAINLLSDNSSSASLKAPSAIEARLRLRSCLEFFDIKLPENQMGDLFREGIPEAQDDIEISLRKLESGAALRLTFDGGFTRLLGLWLAQTYDQAQL